jgi:hypothetical protein
MLVITTNATIKQLRIVQNHEKNVSEITLTKVYLNEHIQMYNRIRIKNSLFRLNFSPQAKTKLTSSQAFLQCVFFHACRGHFCY